MPWKIISLVQGRMRLVKLLLKAEKPVKELCRMYGVSRKTAYKWKERFLTDGVRGLRDLSRRPKESPGQTSLVWRRRIKQLRKKHRHWGARKIRARLKRFHPGESLPGLRTITRWLGRLGLSKARRRRSLPGPSVTHPALTGARRSNQVWTVDFKGWWRTADGARVEPLTVRDLFSRYVLAVRLMPDQQWWRVRAVFTRLFGCYGLPKIIRMDNGKPFGSSGPAGLTRLSAWWTALGIGIEFIAPGHPEQNGGHEQMHRMMKAAVGHPSSTPRAQQRWLNGWRKEYNESRPHQALSDRTPKELYRPSQRVCVRSAPNVGAYRRHWKTRRVRSNGQIRWQGRLRFIGEAFVGYRVGMQPKSQSRWLVYFGPILLGELRATDTGGLRPAVYARRHRKKSKKQKV